MRASYRGRAPGTVWREPCAEPCTDRGPVRPPVRTIGVDGDRARAPWRTGVGARWTERRRSAAHRSWASPRPSNSPSCCRRRSFDEVLVSPLVRARQTAEPLLARLGRDEEIDPWLEEIRDPKWHGTPAEKAADAYAELRGRPAEDRWSGLDGGESVREFVARIRSGAAAFLAMRGVVRSEVDLPIWQIEEPGARILLVAHAGHQLRHHRSSARSAGDPVGVGSLRARACLDQPARGDAAARRLHVLPVEVERRRAPGARRSHAVGADRNGASGEVYRRAHDRRAPLIPIVLKLYSFNVFTQLSGAVTAGMIHLGDRLGLYAALGGSRRAAHRRRAGEPLRPRRTMGARMGLQPGGGEADPADAGPDDANHEVGAERFSLSPEAVAVLASPDHEAFGMGMFHRFPQTMATLEVMPESFRTGLGHDYDSHGPEGAVGIERSFEPWNRHHLVRDVLPALDGVVDALTAGHRRRRHRLRRRGSGDDDGDGVPASRVRRLRHLALRARPGRIPTDRRRPRQRALRRSTRRTDSRPTDGSGSSPRSTASTT